MEGNGRHQTMWCVRNKQEKSVKTILAVLVIGLMTNAFAPSFNIKDSHATSYDEALDYYDCLCCQLSHLNAKSVVNKTHDTRLILNSHHTHSIVFSHPPIPTHFP